MSTGFYLVPQKVLDAELANQNLVSLITNKNRIPNVSYTVSWENGVTGTLSVEVSNDYIPPQLPSQEPANAGHWTPVVLNPPPVAPAGVAGSDHIELILLAAAWVRLVFTDGSGGAGVGTITATIAGGTV